MASIIALAGIACLGGFRLGQSRQRKSDIGQSPLAIARVDKKNLNILDCNQAFATLLGYATAAECQARFDPQSQLEFSLTRTDEYSESVFLYPCDSAEPSIDGLTYSPSGKRYFFIYSVSKVLLGRYSEQMQADFDSQQLLKTQLVDLKRFSQSTAWEIHVAENTIYHDEAWIEELGFAPDNCHADVPFWQSQIVEETKHQWSNVANLLAGKQEYFSADYCIRDGRGALRWLHSEGHVSERNRGNKPLVISGFHLDVTRLHDAKREQKELKVQLLQTQKMETIGLLTGGIAHDFNNFLSSIIGYTELVLHKGRAQLDKRLTDYLAEVFHAGKQAQQLVRGMLEFSRDSDDQGTPTSLQRMTEQAIKLLRPSLPSSLELEVAIEQDLPPVAIDSARLSQILMNLCINAKDAMNGVGTLSVSITNESLNKAECSSCGEEATGEFVQLVVKDTGDGISQKVLTHIFEPFFSTKEVGRGTGMGLSMVHSLVHEHGGHIQVNTEPGKGSSFKILLPPSGEALQKAEIADDQNHQAPKDRLSGKILVIDDQPAIANYHYEMLKNHGHVVSVFYDSAAALAAFESDPFQFDLVITDQTMPKMNGDMLLKKMHAIRPTIPIIICTGFSEHLNETKAKQLGAFGYIKKPIDVIELDVLVARGLAQAGLPTTSKVASKQRTRKNL